MALNETLRLVIDADVKGAVKGLEQVGKTADKELGKTEDRIGKVGRNMQKVGVGMVATGALMVGGLFKAAKASEEAEQSTRKLANSIENNGALAGHSVKEFTDLAAAIQKKTAADGDEVTAGIAVLAQGKLNAQQIKELTPLVVDLARKKGIDEVTAFTMASKAVAGSTGALKKAGIQVDETKAKTDAFGATVDALKGSVGGYAEEEGKTFEGSMQRLKNQLGDIEEGVGKGAVDAFTSLLKPVSALSDKFAELDPDTQSLIGKVSTYSGVALIAAGATSTLIGKVITMKKNFTTAKDGVSSLVQSMGGVSAASVEVTAGLSVMGAVVFGVMQKQEKFAATVRELREEAEATGDSLEVVGLRKMAKAFADSDEVTNSLHRLGMEIGDLKAPLQGTSAEFDAWGDHLRANTDSTAEAQQAAGILIARVGNLRDALGKAKSEQKDTKDAMSAMGIASKDAAGNLDGDLNPALGDAAGETKKLGDATRDLNDALHAQVDPLFAVQDAAKRLKDAQDKVAEATKEHGAKSKETAEANRDALRAAEDYESSLLQLDAAVKDGTVSIDAAKETVARWAAAGYISKDAATQAAYAFGIYGGAASGIPSAVTTTVSTPGLHETISGLQSMISQINAIPGQVPIHVTAGKVSRLDRGYATGGPVYAANGMFMPRGTDTVPAMLTPGEFVMQKKAVDTFGLSTMHAMNQGRMPSGGGVGVVINLQTLDPAAAGRAVVAALKSAESQGLLVGTNLSVKR